MKQITFKELYIQELEDLLSAENQLVNALPMIIEACECQDLAASITGHLERTRKHVERLESVFGMLAKPPLQKTCEAMKGLVKEGQTAVQEIAKGPVRDACLIGACQRIEHYEIAAYGTTRAFAEALGFKEQASILGLTLQEESDANDAFTEIAKTKVNSMALDADLVAGRR